MICVASIRRVARFSGLLILLSSLTWAAIGNCDLNSDSSVNVVDLQLITNMELGTATCIGNVVAPGVCTDAVRILLLNSILNGGCHSIALNWAASSSSGVSGYNIYRSTTSGGPYTKVNSSLVAGTTYYDVSVSAGVTYYYVATAVDGSGHESLKGTETSALVPTP
ncbi:MAG: hypothetical protein LAP40_21660 [Acidobacteriia bacterium]|nr:hypothetical protein [Terriglobia bacterium]